MIKKITTNVFLKQFTHSLAYKINPALKSEKWNVNVVGYLYLQIYKQNCRLVVKQILKSADLKATL